MHIYIYIYVYITKRATLGEDVSRSVPAWRSPAVCKRSQSSSPIAWAGYFAICCMFVAVAFIIILVCVAKAGARKRPGGCFLVFCGTGLFVFLVGPFVSRHLHAFKKLSKKHPGCFPPPTKPIAGTRLHGSDTRVSSVSDPLLLDGVRTSQSAPISSNLRISKVRGSNYRIRCLPQ